MSETKSSDFEVSLRISGELASASSQRVARQREGIIRERLSQQDFTPHQIEDYIASQLGAAEQYLMAGAGALSKRLLAAEDPDITLALLINAHKAEVPQLENTAGKSAAAIADAYITKFARTLAADPHLAQADRDGFSTIASNLLRQR